MKKMLEQYAGAVIAAVVALGIFGILYGRSFGNGFIFSDYLGAMIKAAVFTESVSVRTGSAFDVYMNRTVPVFGIPNCMDLQNGETTSVSSVLQAVDAQGGILDICVQNSWDENFNQTNALEVWDQTNLSFYSSGVFWIELYTADRNGYSRHAVVQMFANER